MRSLRRILLDILIILAVLLTVSYLFQNYAKDSFIYLFGEPLNTIFINDLAIQVSIADTAEERRQGLSGVRSLADNEGKLFIFDEVGYYGIWMKDMLFPIDILWIDEQFKIVHIEQNVRPESYPASYNSPTPARFVLELNAFFVDTFKIQMGDRVSIPTIDLPVNLR